MHIRLLLLALLVACNEPAPTEPTFDDMGADVQRPDRALPTDFGVSKDVASTPDVAPPAPAHLLINEIRCATPSWIEVVNIGEVPADLNRWAIADDRRQERRIHLNGELAPGGYQRVELPFDLYCGDTALRLRDPAGTWSEPLSSQLPVAAASWGRLPDLAESWNATQPTPGLPNEPLHTLGDALFDPTIVRAIDLTLAPLAVAALINDSNIEVTGQLQLDDGPPITVSVHPDGVAGRRRRIDQKSTLQITVRDPNQRLSGLRSLVLDGTPLDPAVLTSWLAGALLRAAGVPAPRAGFAWVRLNGADLGLHLIRERIDADFLGQHYPSTWHLYRGTAIDLRADQVDRFQTIMGLQAERGDLASMVQIIDAISEDDPIYTPTFDYIDWPRVARAMAAEAWIGNVDGYSIGRQTSLLHFDNQPRLSVLPTGFEFALRQTQPFHIGNSVLMRRCLTDPACRLVFDRELGHVIDGISGGDWVAQLDAVVTLLRPYVERDERSLYSVQMFDSEVAIIRAFLSTRIPEGEAVAECLLNSSDEDGDGERCDMDCDPEDGSRYVGARELCGNDVDEDCSGGLNDSPVCPSCQPIQRGDQRYLVCPQRRWYGPARQLCRSFGGDLVTVESIGENGWLHAQANAIRPQDYWIGLTDQDEEGTFRWIDGIERELDLWGNGEPNDANGEDCAHLRGDPRWNDANCDTAKGIICELPCDPTDRDEDGFSSCGLDCDDDDPTVNPNVLEICGDGLNQSCSGRADSGCACVTIWRGPHRYLACPDRQTYAEAREICQSKGADLVILDDAAENIWLYQQAAQIRSQRWWIGLSDQVDEGIYQWWTGQRPKFSAYIRGEPNDWRQTEDCVHFRTRNPVWNDIGCDARNGVLCEEICPEGEDQDEDGALRCDGDCDDGDASRRPGADEICGDLIDQDCDGAVDEGC